MRIPIIGVPGAPQEQRTFAPLSTTTFDQVGQAGARLGGAIEDAATGLPVQIKTALDTATIAKAETQQETHFQSFVDSLKDGKNPENNDPSTFLPRWNDAATGFKDQMSSDSGVKSLSMSARLAYQTSMSKWQAMTTQQVGHLATEKALQNGVGDIKTGYELKLMTGDAKGAEDLVSRGMSTGLINPEEGKEMIFQIPIKTEYNQAVTMMSRDYTTGGGPIVLEKALKATNDDGSFKFYPHLQGQQRETLTFDAYRNARALQAQVAQKYAVQGQSGEQIDPNEVQQDLRLGAITPAVAKALLKPEKTYDATAYANILTTINKADLAHDTDHTKEAAIRAQINEAHTQLDAPSLERLNAVLKDALDPKSPHNAPVASDFFKDAERDRAAGVFLPRAMETQKIPSGHWYVSDKKEQVMGEKADAGEGDVAHFRETAPKAIRDAESQHYAAYITKMREFFSSYAEAHHGSEPTDVQVNEYSQSLKRPYVMAAVAQVITGTGPKPIPAAAVDRLRKDPSLAKDFDAKFGAGASERALKK